MRIYNRKLKEVIEEKESNSKGLNFLYKTILGRVLLKLVFTTHWYGNLVRYFNNTEKSKKKIKPFIEEYNVDVSDWDIENFKSFNDFFCRKKDIKIDKNDYDLISVADSKLSVYKIGKDLRLNIKGSNYSLEDIVKNKEIVKEYKDGLCLVFRLGLSDYHRYVYIDDGFIEDSWSIKGVLHTVRPISKKYNVYKENSREVTILNTQNLDKVVYIEVGAMQVGRIKNNHKIGDFFKKGEEKGHFEYGGSTVIVLIKKEKIIIDDDIVEKKNENIEVKVNIGERVGIVCEKL